MIYIVTRHDSAHTVAPLARQTAEHGAADVRLLSYGDLFHKCVAPVGHYVFTDFDRLSSYEVQAAETIARRVEAVAPATRILNRPITTLERYPLLRRLARMGLNDFSAVRLDSDDVPGRYPVFIRLEDDCKYPDTGLLHSEEELAAAIGKLKANGLPLKRRIAVEFCAESDADGHYRKYGVFRLGDHLIPQHLMIHTDWYVKRSTTRGPRGQADPFADEKARFLSDFPHEPEIRRRFDIAGISFGRIDYAIVGGRIQTYEINTNPTFPPLWSVDPNDPRADRRTLFRSRILAALQAIDTPFDGPPEVRFDLPEPRLQTFGPVPPPEPPKARRRKVAAEVPPAASTVAPEPATEPT